MKIIGRGDYSKRGLLGKGTTRTGDYMERRHTRRRDYKKGREDTHGEGRLVIRRSKLHREGRGGIRRLIQRPTQRRTQKRTQRHGDIHGERIYDC